MKIFGLHVITQTEVDRRYEAARTDGYNNGRRGAFLGQGWREWMYQIPPDGVDIRVTRGDWRKTVETRGEYISLEMNVNGLLWTLIEDK